MTEAQARYRTLVAAGLCAGCKGTPEPGKRRCKKCQSKCVPQTAEAKEIKRILGTANKRKRWCARVANGHCGNCGDTNPGRNPRTGKRYVECAVCQEQKREFQRRRRGHRRLNHCGRCGEPGHARTSCRRIKQARLDRPAPYAPLDVDEYATARLEATT